MKFYLKRNAAKPLNVEGESFDFIICEQSTGSWLGVYRAEKESEIATLDKAVADGLIWEIDNNSYNIRLMSRKRERLDPRNIETAADPTIREPKPEPKAAQVESVTDVTETDLNATSSVESNEGKAYIKTLTELAEALEVTEDELAEIRAREGCPGRAGKGYHVRSFREFITGAEKIDKPTD